MVNSVQQQVDAYESAGIGALQQMQKLDPKMVVGIALENLEQGLKADQRAKSMSNANVGPSVIDKKLMGLGGLGLGQQEALNTARPGTQIRGQQLQANRLAQAIQRAQKRPAGGIASMPMMRNQMRRMADGGNVSAGLPAIGKGQPIPMLMQKYGSEKVMEFLKEEKRLKDIESNVAPELRKDFEMMKANIESRFDPQMIRAIRRTRSGPDEVDMQAGGAVKKFQPGGSVTGALNPQTGLPYTQEEFDVLMEVLDAARDTSIKVGDDTMVDASRLPRDSNRLTPGEQSERDLAIIERRRADLEKPSEEPSILQSITAGITAGLPALREEISGFIEGARRAPAAMQRTIADTPMGQEMLREQEQRVVDRQNAREREQLDNMYATQNTLARSQLTDEQRLKDILQKGKLVAPSTMTEEEAEKSRAGIQPEKTPMSDKIFSLLQTLGDFSGAPKGYEGATFLARRRSCKFAFL